MESCVPLLAARLPYHSFLGGVGRFLRRNPVVKKSLGFAWVFAFFFWSVPKWQYPHARDFIQRIGR
jgi:hypothetical protein